MEIPSMSIVYDYTVAGTKQGLDLKQIQEIIAVEFAIQSGDMELPWSQEEIENNSSNEYGPQLRDTYKLINTNPAFTRIAARWAYATYPQIFYMLHNV